MPGSAFNKCDKSPINNKKEGKGTLESIPLLEKSNQNKSMEFLQFYCNQATTNYPQALTNEKGKSSQDQSNGRPIFASNRIGKGQCQSMANQNTQGQGQNQGQAGVNFKITKDKEQKGQCNEFSDQFKIKSDFQIPLKNQYPSNNCNGNSGVSEGKNPSNYFKEDKKDKKMKMNDMASNIKFLLSNHI